MSRLRRRRVARDVGIGARLVAVLAIVAVVLWPLVPTLAAGFRAPGGGPMGVGATGGDPFAGIVATFRYTPALTWLGNSLLVTLTTVLVAVVVAAPAAYTLSRSRGRLVSGFSMVLFLLQAMPVVLLVIPMFILFAGIGLVDDLGGLLIIYVAMSLAVATWMLVSAVDAVPISLEQAAWIDGCSVFGGFVRIVLRSCWPGMISAAIYCFLLTWNDYLVALVFLKTPSNYTLPIGMESARTPGLVLVVVLPPLLTFLLLNRYFSVGGIAGSLADR